MVGADGADHGELTLRAVLDEPTLGDARCVGPDPDEDELRPVRWVLPLASALEPDMADLDGVIVHAGCQRLDRRAAAELHRRGACAVVVTPETGAAAAAAGLVVIESEVGFYRLNHLVAEKALAQRAHVLEYGMNVHKVLSEVLYRGMGLRAITSQLSKLSGSPTALLDVQLNVLTYESLLAPPTVDPTELLRLLREMIESGSLAREVEQDPQLTATLTLELPQGPAVCVVCPIMLGGTTYGWIVIMELQYPPPDHDLAQHRALLEHGVSIVGAEMLRLRSISEAEERARGDFTHALLHGRYTDPHELETRATFHDFDTRAAYGVIVVQGATDTGTSAGLERQANLVRWVRDQGRRGPRTLAAVVGDLLCVVREVPEAERVRAGPDDTAALASFARHLNLELRARTSAQLRVAYGRPGPGASGVADSYREARVALALSSRLGLGPICGYSDLRVYAVLSELAGSSTGETFWSEILSPLRSRATPDDLEEVVLAYIASGGNLNAVARSLNLHRNTVQYKLNRASQLLSMDLHQAEHRFTFWLASRLELLGKVQNQIGT